MRTLKLPAFCLALGTWARADLPIAIPAPASSLSTQYQVGVDGTSANALEIKRLTGATYYAGKASSASLTETTDSGLALRYSLVYSPDDSAYGTRVGILLPLTPTWTIKNFTAMTGISYQVKCATPGLTVHMLIGSDAYPQDMKNESSALVSAATAALTTAYTTINVLPTELQSPGWAKASNALATGWKVDPNDINYVGYTVGIGEFVRNLDFQPIVDPAWETGGTAFKTTPAALVAISNTVTIRNVVVKGIGGPRPPYGNLCSGNFVFLDDFSNTSWVDGTPRTGNAPNYFGGYWYAFSDTASAPVAGKDTAVGLSTIALPAGKNSWMPVLGAGAFLTATLEKNVPTSTYLYHKYAGWAGIGTDLTSPETGEPTNLSDMNGGSLTAIGFDLYAGAATAAVVPGATFDTNLVKQITLKLGKASVGDSVAYQIDIAANKAVTGRTGQGDGLPNLCVDLTDLAQPAWYSAKQGGAVLLVADDLIKISWEIRIEDQSDSTKHSSGPNTFGVTNVKFYGLYSPSGVKRADGHHFGLTASYRSGLLLSYTVPGSSALVEVRNLSGSRIASFQKDAKVRNLSLPLSLARGTYVVSVQGTGARQTALLNVAR